MYELKMLILFIRSKFCCNFNVSNTKLTHMLNILDKFSMSVTGTNGFLTHSFCHLFWDLLRCQQMRSRSLHTSGSNAKREARLIPLIWLVRCLPGCWSFGSWGDQQWPVVCGLAQCYERLAPVL